MKRSVRNCCRNADGAVAPTVALSLFALIASPAASPSTMPGWRRWTPSCRMPPTRPRWPPPAQLDRSSRRLRRAPPRPHRRMVRNETCSPTKTRQRRPGRDHLPGWRGRHHVRRHRQCPLLAGQGKDHARGQRRQRPVRRGPGQQPRRRLCTDADRRGVPVGANRRDCVRRSGVGDLQGAAADDLQSGRHVELRADARHRHQGWLPTRAVRAGRPAISAFSMSARPTMARPTCLARWLTRMRR